MQPTLAKILSRFDGNKVEAMRYCIRISIQYPQLAKEYDTYAKALAGK